MGYATVDWRSQDIRDQGRRYVIAFDYKNSPEEH